MATTLRLIALLNLTICKPISAIEINCNPLLKAKHCQTTINAHLNHERQFEENYRLQTARKNLSYGGLRLKADSYYKTLALHCDSSIEIKTGSKEARASTNLLTTQIGRYGADNFVINTGYQPYSMLKLTSAKAKTTPQKALLEFQPRTLGIRIDADDKYSKTANFIIGKQLQTDHTYGASIIFNYDILSLNSTRTTFAIFSNTQGQRQWSFSLLSKSINGSETLFQVSRKRKSPDGKSTPFQQLIEIETASPLEAGTQTRARYTQERFSHKTLYLEYLKQLSMATIRAGITYSKKEETKNTHSLSWHASIGTR